MNVTLLTISTILVILIFLGLRFGFTLDFESENAYKTIVFENWTLTVYYKVKPEYLAEIRQKYPDFPEIVEHRIF